MTRIFQRTNEAENNIVKIQPNREKKNREKKNSNRDKSLHFHRKLQRVGREGALLS